MNKDTLVTLAFSFMAMVVGMIMVSVVQTAMIHASTVIAICFGFAGFAVVTAIAACAVVIHREGSK